MEKTATARRFIIGLLAAYLVFCLVSGVFLAGVAFHPPRLQITHANSSNGMAARFGADLQNVSITAADGITLRAWFVRPKKTNGDTVILLHGIGDNREGMMGYAELFLSHGYTVLVPDSRAHGESGGGFATYGIKERDDVWRWLDWLSVPEQPRCIFGMGESAGASILLQSLQRNSLFCAVVAESPFSSFRQVAYLRVGQFLHVGPWLGRIVLRPAVETAFLVGKLRWGVNLADASPADSVRGASVPVLLIHGLADHNIPPRQSELIRAVSPTRITLWEVPNAGHCGAVNAAGEEFNRRVIDWFASHPRRTSSVHGAE